jgi:hypothetical protein
MEEREEKRGKEERGRSDFVVLAGKTPAGWEGSFS